MSGWQPHPGSHLGNVIIIPACNVISRLKSQYFLWCSVFKVDHNFFLTSLLECNCFTMVCQFLLYNKVNQLYVYIYPHISSLLRFPPTLPIPPLQVVTKHRADLPVLCGCFPLAIYFTFGSVYMSLQSGPQLFRGPISFLFSPASPNSVHGVMRSKVKTKSERIKQDL